MTQAGGTRVSRRGRWIGAGIALGILVLMAGANVHLVHVARLSQPECIPHLKTVDDSGIRLRAAKSSC